MTEKALKTTVTERDYGDPRYYAVLDEMRALHRKKAADYGHEKDGLHNLRQSEAFGIPAWVAALVRGNDKMGRLQAAAAGTDLANEGIEDSLIDLAAYAVLALVLYRETLSAKAQQVQAEVTRISRDFYPDPRGQLSEKALREMSRNAVPKIPMIGAAEARRYVGDEL